MDFRLYLLDQIDYRRLLGWLAVLTYLGALGVGCIPNAIAYYVCPLNTAYSHQVATYHVAWPLHPTFGPSVYVPIGT